MIAMESYVFVLFLVDGIVHRMCGVSAFQPCRNSEDCLTCDSVYCNSAEKTALVTVSALLATTLVWAASVTLTAKMF